MPTGSKVTFDAVRQIALSLDNVIEGTPAFLVRRARGNPVAGALLSGLVELLEQRREIDLTHQGCGQHLGRWAPDARPMALHKLPVHVLPIGVIVLRRYSSTGTPINVAIGSVYSVAPGSTPS